MTGTEAAADLLAPGVVIRVPAAERWDVEFTPVAAALAVGTAVDLTGVGDWVFLAAVDVDVVGVADTVGVAAPVGERAGFVAVGFGLVAVAVGDAWPPDGAVGCAEGRVLALGVD